MFVECSAIGGLDGDNTGKIINQDFGKIFIVNKLGKFANINRSVVLLANNTTYTLQQFKNERSGKKLNYSQYYVKH